MVEVKLIVRNRLTAVKAVRSSSRVGSSANSAGFSKMHLRYGIIKMFSMDGNLISDTSHLVLIATASSFDQHLLRRSVVIETSSQPSSPS